MQQEITWFFLVHYELLKRPVFLTNQRQVNRLPEQGTSVVELFVRHIFLPNTFLGKTISF